MKGFLMVATLAAALLAAPGLRGGPIGSSPTPAQASEPPRCTWVGTATEPAQRLGETRMIIRLKVTEDVERRQGTHGDEDVVDVDYSGEARDYYSRLNIAAGTPLRVYGYLGDDGQCLVDPLGSERLRPMLEGYVEVTDECRTASPDTSRAVERAISKLGCAVGPALTATVALQPFQGGRMLYWHGIYVLATAAPPYLCQWSGQPDPSGGTESPPPELTPPSGVVVAQRGFGKVWQESYGGPGGQLGWATQDEHSERATWQQFEEGIVVVTQPGVAWVLYNRDVRRDCDSAALWATWTRVGPDERTAVYAVALAPGWPGDPLLLAAGPDGIIRTRDGGTTWEHLPPPAPDVSFEYRYYNPVGFLGVAPARGDAAVAFFVGGRENVSTLYRSSDAGTSWTAVLPRARELVLSPAFAQDGLAFAIVADGRLYRSRDAGASWEELHPAADQFVSQAAFSPDFARDHTLFVVAVSSVGPASAPDLDDHEASRGVLVSTDGGDTWADASTGLAVDGTPYRNVDVMAVSPTFATDDTLFAFGLGPRRPANSVSRKYTWPGQLFRSRDRGRSWEPVAVPYPGSGPTVHFALSPELATDGQVFLVVTTVGTTPAQTGCTGFQTNNGGADWNRVLAGTQYTGCDNAYAIGAGAQFTVVMWRSGGQGSSVTALPAGAPAQEVARRNPLAIVRSPDYARDHMLLVGTNGVWRYGPVDPPSGGPAAGRTEEERRGP